MSWVPRIHNKILCQLLRKRRYYLQFNITRNRMQNPIIKTTQGKVKYFTRTLGLQKLNFIKGWLRDWSLEFIVLRLSFSKVAPSVVCSQGQLPPTVWRNEHSPCYPIHHTLNCEEEFPLIRKLSKLLNDQFLIFYTTLLQVQKLYEVKYDRGVIMDSD
jgi:hypothetical protein